MNDGIQLLPHEKVVMRFRKHGIMLFFDTIGTIIALFVPFILFSLLAQTQYVPDYLRTPEVIAFASAFWLLIIWCALAIEWTDYYLDIWIVTDSRIINISQIGLFNRNVSTWGIERIQEITIHSENVVQSFFNYGTLQIQTSGPSDEYARAIGVPNPERVRTVMMSQISHIGELKKMNEDQEALLHTVSHEVKGYLTHDAAALSAIAEDSSIGNQPLQALARRALGETRKGVSAIMNLLQDSDLKTGATRISTTSFDVRTVVQSLADEYKPTADRKQLLLRIMLGSNPCMVTGDLTKLRDLVFRNLIENALNYTEKGSVQIAVSSNGNRVRFSVSDTGIGITTDDMGKLFSPGGHGKNSQTINPASTGYGLSSAKQIVDAHGGKIWAESEGEHMGTIFYVELPADKKTV